MERERSIGWVTEGGKRREQQRQRARERRPHGDVTDKGAEIDGLKRKAKGSRQKGKQVPRPDGRDLQGGRRVCVDVGESSVRWE